MVEYGAATTCRRRLLLEYFDETWQQDNCAACDICLTEESAGQNSDRMPESTGAVPFDGTEIAQKVLSAVVRTGGRFGAAHIVGVLRGSRSRRVLELGHDKLTVYGIAREIPQHELRDIDRPTCRQGPFGRGDRGISHAGCDREWQEVP